METEDATISKATQLEVVLRLHGQFRRCLEPLHATPLQAGVVLYLQRHGEAKVKDAAAAFRGLHPCPLGFFVDNLWAFPHHK